MNIVIHFFNGNDVEIQQHYFQKEYRDDILIEVDGLFYEVYFFTDNSLQYEMREGGYFSSPGLIILEEISSSKIIAAVRDLIQMDYFKWFNGKHEMSINNRFVQKLYRNKLDSFSKSPKSSLIIPIGTGLSGF